MIANNDRIHDDLEDVYTEGIKATGTILEAIFQAIQEAKRNRDLKTLEITQEEDSKIKEPFSLDDLTIESNSTSTPKLELDDLTIEQDDRKRKGKEGTGVDTPSGEKKILFGMGENGFVNNLSPEQEKSIAKMLMNKPGAEIPGAENLTIRYKGEIIASTNDQGILEANELYGKLSPETLQRLAEQVAKTPYANAPKRASEQPSPETSQEVAETPKPAPKQSESPAVVAVAEPPTPAPVVEEPRIPRPVKRTSVLDGNPVTQVQAALAAVAVAGNGVGAIATEIQATTVEAVAKVIDPRAIAPSSITGIPDISKGKAAGIMNWMRDSIKEDGQPIQSPNGYVASIARSDDGQEKYTLKDKEGQLVLSATVDNSFNRAEMVAESAVSMDVYSSKGIGREWEAIKKSLPKPQQEASIETPINEAKPPQIDREISLEELAAIKNITDAYVVKEGIGSALAKTDSNPNLLLGYEKLPDGNIQYSLYDKTDPYAKVSFTYDEKNGEIQDVKQTTTPSMLSFVEKANAHMRQENIEIKDAADKVNVAEDREPGTQAAAPVVKLGNEIPISSVPTPTTQSADVTAKLTQQQVAMVSKSITIVEATCLDLDNREAELEHTRVSIEDKDKDTKLYTLQDLSTKDETQFSHNNKTGEVVVYKESDAVSISIDKEEKIFAPVIPGYPEIIKTTSQQIEKGGEITLSKGKGQIARSPASKTRSTDRGGK
jgi:hypothetical protein